MDEIRFLLMELGIPPYFADIGFWVTLLGVVWGALRGSFRAMMWFLEKTSLMELKHRLNDHIDEEMDRQQRHYDSQLADAVESINKLTESNQAILQQLVRFEERDTAIFNRIDNLEKNVQTLSSELMHIQVLNNVPIHRAITINEGGTNEYPS